MGHQKNGKAVVAWLVIHRDGWRLPKLNQICKVKRKRDLIAVALMYAMDLFKVDLAAPRAWPGRVPQVVALLRAFGNCSSEPATNLGLLRRVCMDGGERFIVGVVAGL